MTGIRPVAARNPAPADPQLEADLACLRLIYDLRGKGFTWAFIGHTLDMTGPQAKRHWKRLGTKTGRAWRLQQNQQNQES